MKTGIELIAEERSEQIEKHGFSLELDARYYKNKELVQAAEFCLLQAGFSGYEDKNVFWPSGWDKHFMNKILNKSRIGQLTVAGAFLKAENERRGDDLHDYLINDIAGEIDRLNIQNK